MARKDQVGKGGRKSPPPTVRRINVVISGHEDEYTTALVNAFNAAPDDAHFIRVRTERTRILDISGRSLTPRKTTGHRLRRTFIFEVPAYG